MAVVQKKKTSPGEAARKALACRVCGRTEADGAYFVEIVDAGALCGDCG